ncbi:hypothetical protein C9374_005836 [Naegleria lovaniensis]|uniref:Uncharacterized protein n=1 Tax=Naegleria lovaniensis TaxID=51637 RepID=A0AA88GN54_NAELO|nr:uncharacterized protein C9374_005836 [Naegleria lovaniensis]KAG2382044.1 hypothetical protein C9374_005836 [Naegleria lovaniensis]
MQQQRLNNMLPPNAYNNAKVSTVIKILVVGERNVGKSALISSWCGVMNEKNHLIRFVDRRSSGEIDVTRVEVSTSASTATGKSRSITMGEEIENANFYIDFCEPNNDAELPTNDASVKSAWMMGTDFVLIVYDTSNLVSWNAATTKWLSWFQEYETQLNTIMLVGTKNDLPRKVVPIKECEQFCKSYISSREENGYSGIGSGLFFMELSAKLGTNVELVLSILLIRISHLLTYRKESARANPPSLGLFGMNSHMLYSHDMTSEDTTRSLTIEELPVSNRGSPSFNQQQRVSTACQTPPDISAASTTRIGTDHKTLKEPISPTLKTSNQDQTLSTLSHTSFEIENNYGINSSGLIVLPPVDSTAQSTTDGCNNNKSDTSAKKLSRNQKPSSVQTKIQNFQETKQGYVIPVIETDLFSDQKHHIPSKPQQVQQFISHNFSHNEHSAKVILSINIGDGKMCKLGVVSGDNIFHLAELVVKQFELDPKLRSEIAFNIRNSINKYIDKANGSLLKDKKNNPKLKEAEKFNQTVGTMFSNTTQQTPFNFVSDWIKPTRPPILQLKITISKGKTGVIVIREGDDITELARNFVSTFGLKKEQLPKIVEKIKKHLEDCQEGIGKSASGRPFSNSREETSIVVEKSENPLSAKKSQQPKEKKDPKEAKALLATTLASSPHTPRPGNKVLFNLDVEINENNRKILTVREGDDPHALAHEFAKHHSIGSRAEEMLVQLVQYHMKKYYEQKKLPFPSP